MSGYSGTPLVKKLGIKEGAVVLLISSPQDFLETLGSLPADAEIVSPRQREKLDVVAVVCALSEEAGKGVCPAGGSAEADRWAVGLLAKEGGGSADRF